MNRSELGSMLWVKKDWHWLFCCANAHLLLAIFPPIWINTSGHWLDPSSALKQSTFKCQLHCACPCNCVDRTGPSGPICIHVSNYSAVQHHAWWIFSFRCFRAVQWRGASALSRFWTVWALLVVFLRLLMKLQVDWVEIMGYFKTYSLHFIENISKSLWQHHWSGPLAADPQIK